MSDKRNENTEKKGTCVYEKDIHVSHKGQDAATNRKRAGHHSDKGGRCALLKRASENTDWYKCIKN